MNKKVRPVVWIVGGIIAVIVVLLIIGISLYNGLVRTELAVESKEATIDTMLTRRADLIPNLVSTVKGYAAHEEEIYTDLAEARAQLAGSTRTEDKWQANAALNSALSRLLVVVENYPELQASRQFLALQDQLEGAENRIATARVDYNNAVQAYNTKLRRFPSNFIGMLFGFEKKTLYDAPEGSEQPPSVEF